MPVACLCVLEMGWYVSGEFLVLFTSSFTGLAMKYYLGVLLSLFFCTTGYSSVQVLHLGTHSTAYDGLSASTIVTQSSVYSGQTGMDVIYFDEHFSYSAGFGTADILALFNSGVDLVFAQPYVNTDHQSIIAAILGTSLDYNVNTGGSHIGNLVASAPHPIFTGAGLVDGAGVDLNTINEYYFSISGLPIGAVQIAESLANGTTAAFTYESSGSRMVVFALEPMEGSPGPNADERQLAHNAIIYAANGSSVVPEPSAYVVYSGLILCFGLVAWRRRSVQKA